MRLNKCFQKLKSSLLLIFFVLTLNVTSSAQDDAPSESSLLKEVMFHSPNVSTLGKFGEVPVGYYTGVPNISIPIYEASSGPLSLPVSLNYHAGGVRVEEVASNVGLSWALQAGGVITRSVRGYPDYRSFWYGIPVEKQIETYMNSNLPPPDDLLLDIDASRTDGEADIFNFNFGGHSGKFILDQNGNPHLIPKSNLLVSQYQEGWKIVDEMGTQYLFQKYESEISPSMDIINAWVLTDVLSSDGKHNISLTYEDGYVSYSVFAGETKYFTLNAQHCNDDRSLSGNANNSFQRLTRIDFATGHLKFVYGAERCDVLADKMLDEIAIYSKDDKLIKKFVLAHSYFGSNSSCYINQHQRRLKLNSVTEVTPSETKPPYIFSYDESEPLPSRLSFSQDHWGYFNDADNSTLIPTFPFVQVYFQGADRSVNPTKAQLGILKSIKYPTGGSTQFTYESNKTSDTRLGPQEFEERTLAYSFSTPNFPVVNMPNTLLVAPLNVPAGGAIIDDFTVTGLDPIPWPLCDTSGVWLTKDGVLYRKLESTSTGTTEFTGSLAAGTYGLALAHDCPEQSIMPSPFTINIRVLVPKPINDSLPMNAGGLRIKQIEDIPGDGGLPVTRQFKYTPGILTNIPVYTSQFSTNRIVFNGLNSPNTTRCIDVVATSQSKYPLATTSSSYVSYHDVTEVLSNGGENEYSYLSFSGANYPSIPFAPVEARNWRRGSLKGMKSYSNESGQLKLVKEVSNDFTEFGTKEIWGLKVWRTAENVYIGTPPPEFIKYIIVPTAYMYYNTSSTFFGIKSTTEKVYPEPGNLSKVLETKKEYTYDPNHLQVIEEKVTITEGTSGKKQQVAHRKYPSNYSFSGTPSGLAAQGIKKLQDLHVVGVPVEEYVVKQDLNDQNQVSNRRVTGSTLTTFRSDNPYPDEIYKLKLSQPVSLSGFVPSSIVSNSFQKSTLYEPLAKFVKYDVKGNLLTQQKINDAPISYLWGYDNTFPVAEIKNATNSSGTTELPFSYSNVARITTYTSNTPILPEFEITTTQQISVTVGLTGEGNDLPLSPFVDLMLLRPDGTIAYSISPGVWGPPRTFSISLTPNTYQWYYYTGDIYFDAGFTAVTLSLSTAYTSGKTGSRIFYTSFEEEGNHTAVSYTGKKAWSGKYTVYLPATNGNYMLTYMKWNGGAAENWEYVTVPISVTTGAVQAYNVGGAGIVIDEVRLYPADAQMTTYSYDPFFGMTSGADANCEVSYYNYDSFGRLKNIKDHKRNIVKSFDYHYKGGN